MQQSTIELTRDNLFDFLDFVAEKGLMKRQTAVSYKKASKIVLGILNETETTDLSKINLESVIVRHRNLAAGKISPTTLRTYESRTRAAVNAFLDYAKDPSSWKPSTKQRTRRAIPTAKKSKNREQVSKSKEIVDRKEISPRPSIHVDFQIHISPESTPEQIDKIFESMSRHFGKGTD
ncbi:hypothetical protein ES703_99468 [subsurface metagenome]